MEIIGWVVWSIGVIILLIQIPLAISMSDPGVKILAKRFCVLLALGRIITVISNISKLHLIWWIPLSFLLNFSIFRFNMQRQVIKFAKQSFEHEDITANYPDESSDDTTQNEQLSVRDLADCIWRLDSEMRCSYNTLYAYIHEELPYMTDDEIETAYTIAVDPECRKLKAKAQRLENELDELVGNNPVNRDEKDHVLFIFWMYKTINNIAIDYYSIEKLKTSKMIKDNRKLSMIEEAQIIRGKQKLDDSLKELDQLIETKVTELSGVDPAVVADLVEVIWYYNYYLDTENHYSEAKLSLLLQLQVPVTDDEIKAAYSIATDPGVVNLLNAVRFVKRKLDKLVGSHNLYQNDMRLIELVGQKNRYRQSRVHNLYER